MKPDTLLTMDMFKKAEEYWLKKLVSDIPQLELPRDYPGGDRVARENYRIHLKKEVTEKILHTSNNKDLLIFVILLAALQVVLYKFTGQRDGIVVSSTLKKTKQSYNKYVFLRDILEPDMSFKQFLMAVKLTVADGYKNQYYPANKLLDLLNIQKGISLFRVVLLLESIHDNEFTGDYIDQNDFILSVKQTGRELEINVNYDSSLYTIDTLKKFVKCYSYVLEQVMNDISVRIADVEIASTDEKNKIIHQFNHDSVRYSGSSLIHKLFEFQVEKTPGSTAVKWTAPHSGRKDKHREITYRELNEKADLLAMQLLENNVTPGSVVAVLVDRSIEMIIGILAILKAGGAYLPIAPDYPVERKRFMLADSNARLILTQRRIIEADDGLFQNLDLPGILMIPDVPDWIKREKDIAALTDVPVSPGNAVYVIYTSGSTGRPKGVIISHLSLVNLVYSYRRTFGEEHLINMSQAANIGFDAMAFEVWPCLLSGGTLYIVPDTVRLDIPGLKQWLVDNEITISFQPTPIAEQLIESPWPQEDMALKILLTAGDKLNRYPPVKLPFVLYNLYGPTEDTVWTTWAIVDGIGELDKSPFIGRPVPNHQVYILGPDARLQPIGIQGELCIGGNGLAAGYLNRPQLTADKFVRNPLLEDRRLFKTGDLAKWQPDGNIEFMGRKDYQVKIRGFRIETSEIEFWLLKRCKIEAALVLARGTETTGKYLCAYIVGSEKPDPRELKEYLANYLPYYMIPDFYIKLETMPLTPNGKIDRNVLPEPEIETSGVSIMPRDNIEQILADIWFETLNVSKEKMSIDSNFFELGGHSLTSTILAMKIHNQLNVKVPLDTIFNSPTIRALAQYVRGAEKILFIALEPAPLQDYYALSSVQLRMYFLQIVNTQNTSYNIPTVLQLDGDVNRNKLEDTFRKLIKRHDSLRTSFQMIGNKPVQIIHQDIPFKMQYIDAPGIDFNTGNLKNFIRPFDLSQAPLFRVVLIYQGNDRYILVTDMHHIISDRVSQEVLINNFVFLYSGEELEELKLQYKDYSEWQNRLLESREIEKQEEYWLEIFSGEIPRIQLPTDYPDTDEKDFAGRKVNFEIEPERLKILKSISLEDGTTTFMMMLAIFNIFLSRLTGQDDIIVGSSIVGRRHLDLQKIIGLFINTLALRNAPAGHKTFRNFLREVKTGCLKAFDNQDYQFETLVEKVVGKRSATQNPLFNIMFEMDTPGEPTFDNFLEFKVSPVKFDTNTSKFDMMWVCFDVSDHLYFTVTYRTAIFKKETIERFIQYFNNIVTAVTDHKEIKLEDIKISNQINEINDNPFRQNSIQFDF